jgi:hypothetical protein
MKTYVPIHSSLAKKRCLWVAPLIRTEGKIPIKQKHPGFPSIKSACISSLYYKVFWHFLQYRRLCIENLTTRRGANSVHDNITEENPPQYMTSVCSYYPWRPDWDWTKQLEQTINWQIWRPERKGATVLVMQLASCLKSSKPYQKTHLRKPKVHRCSKLHAVSPCLVIWRPHYIADLIDFICLTVGSKENP